MVGFGLRILGMVPVKVGISQHRKVVVRQMVRETVLDPLKHAFVVMDEIKKNARLKISRIV